MKFAPVILHSPNHILPPPSPPPPLSLSSSTGRHVDIIRRGEANVESDGILQLSTNLTEDGSGMMPMMNPLPAIPSDVSAVTISWHANEMVSQNVSLCGYT